MAELRGRVDEEDIDDDISVTSTLQETLDSDEEWPVSKILAESNNGDRTDYLIEWQGFALHEATWEPVQNLNHSLMDGWEETKANQNSGKIPKFKICHWRKACIQNFKSKLSRHEKRNLKRARLGLQTTDLGQTLEEYVEALSGYPEDDDSDEDMEYPLGEHENPNEAASLVPFGKHQANQSQGSGSKKGSVSSVSGPGRGLERKNKPEKSLTATAATSQTLLARQTGVKSGTMQKSHTHVARLSSGQHNRLASSGILSTGNIFASGKTRKIKQTLVTAVSDPNKKPKLFTKYSQVRTLEKSQRDKEGATAPSQFPKSLFSLAKGMDQDFNTAESIQPPRENGQLSGEGLDGSDTEMKDSGQEVSTQERHAGQAPGTFSESVNRATLSTKKKRRSVRWKDQLEDLDQVEHQEESLFIPDSVSTVERNSNESKPLTVQRVDEVKYMSGATAQTQDTRSKSESNSGREDRMPVRISQTISKVVKLGQSVPTVTLTFAEMPIDDDLLWLSTLKRQRCLNFTHSCTAADFASQNDLRALSARKLAEGPVDSATGKEALEILADRLRLGSMGILSYCEGFFMLLLPSKCEGWIPEILDEREDKLKESSLSYSIFIPSSTFEASMLAPFSWLDYAAKGDPSSALYRRPFDAIFGPTYDQILSKGTANSLTKDSFFLAFPRNAGQEAAMVSWWLRNSHPGCDIRTSYFPGHWASFVEQNQGVVIIHEDAIWAIRQFPKIGDLLHDKRAPHNFWLFSRPVLPISINPVLEGPSPAIGDMCLSRIFPPGGIAILVTPSFFVAQPEQAYNFVKWFWQNYSSKTSQYRNGQLVVCARIDDWLLDLIEEKHIFRKSLIGLGSTEILVQEGVSDKAVEARLKSWSLLHQLTLESTDEITNPLVFAPECIDGNDEQSLVNWFGHWSIMHMKRFRKFRVLGSSKAKSKRLTRKMKLPVFANSTPSDPDEVDESPNDAKPENTSLASNALPQHDQLVQIKIKLHEILMSIKSLHYCPVSLYKFPVAYWDADMPFRFKDLTSTYHTYATWFKFFWGMFKNKTGPARFFNTYTGLFHTVDENCGPDSKTLRRRPWIAIFRPTNLHIRQWESSEIFIWDSTYKDIMYDATMYTDDLPQAQQELIQYIGQQVKDTLPLRNVWIAGFSSDMPTVQTNALDTTLAWLKYLLPNVKSWLPAATKDLPHRGWCLISYGERPKRSAEDAQSVSLDAMDVTIPTDESVELQKVVFHAPRGSNESQAVFTQCKNRLLQRALAHDSHEKVVYSFRPTMDWYTEQCDEGRGFEHIKVTSWEDVFRHYSIDDPKGV